MNTLEVKSAAASPIKAHVYNTSRGGSSRAVVHEQSGQTRTAWVSFETKPAETPLSGKRGGDPIESNGIGIGGGTYSPKGKAVLQETGGKIVSAKA